MSIFADRTYDKLMEEALSRVSDIYDKREGSMIFNGNAPCLAEMAQVYMAIDYFLESTYIHSTSDREYLIKRAKDHQIYPEQATPSVHKGEFDNEVPIGSRFSLDDLNFVVRKELKNEDSTERVFYYELECETVGSLSNTYSGNLIAIEDIPNLTSAKLVECLVNGVDEEDTEVFRTRVLEALKSIAFGGNRADYRNWVLHHIDDETGVKGAKAVKVYPIWNEDINPSALVPSSDVTSWYDSIIDSISNTDAKEWLAAVYTAAKLGKLTVGGAVKVVFLAHGKNGGYAVPTPEYVEIVQNALDPKGNEGEGMGIAPIGHVVTVEGAQEEDITITTNITCKNCTFEDIKVDVENAVKKYFNELKGEWENTENLIVRISQIESRILSDLPGYVVDITGTKINDEAQNLKLNADYIPKLIEVINKGG